MPDFKKEYLKATIGIIGFEEEGEWVALALEMDLRGYGDTFEAAVEDLSDLVLMQISFSAFKDEPQLLWRPADPVYWELYAEARRQRIELLGREIPDSPEAGIQIGGLPIPPAHVIAALRDQFLPANG
jgi:hypothetical protein